MGVNKTKGGDAMAAMAQKICIAGLFQLSAAFADKASINAPHHRNEALGFNTIRILDRGQALFRFGAGTFRRTNLSHFGCSLSVMPVTRSDRPSSGLKRFPLPE
jgi:hypothetical protein